ncbi:MAG: hypothetical protein Kow0037_10300 [Calditrichia bacterium]
MNVFIKREYDYAIRIVAYLAGLPEGEIRSVTEIAQKLFITRPFASKIIHTLKNAEIVKTVQGKQGGIFLNQNPAELSVLQILEAMGFDSTINECVKLPGICPLNGFCKIHTFFVEQERQLIRNLAAKKIADFAFRESQLNKTLNL